MKINQRIYNMVNTEPFEKQELEKHNVELYKLNDYPELLKDFTSRGKFSVWSSLDGQNYRLLVEEGYYNTLKELHSKKINSEWLAFWDSCDDVTRWSRKIIFPITFVTVGIVFASNFFLPDEMKLVFPLIFVGLFFVSTLGLRKITNRKISMANGIAIDNIKKILGSKKFDILLEKQRNYIDEYFGYSNEEEIVETSEINVIENTESEEVQVVNVSTLGENVEIAIGETTEEEITELEIEETAEVETEETAEVETEETAEIETEETAEIETEETN